jgi:hypothetical protein
MSSFWPFSLLGCNLLNQGGNTLQTWYFRGCNCCRRPNIFGLSTATIPMMFSPPWELQASLAMLVFCATECEIFAALWIFERGKNISEPIWPPPYCIPPPLSLQSPAVESGPYLRVFFLLYIPFSQVWIRLA